MILQPIDFDGRKETCLCLHATEAVTFLKETYQVNFFQCSTCDAQYFYEDVFHRFCPVCGVGYKYFANLHFPGIENKE